MLSTADEVYAWWKYLLMPFISGIVGWFTNVLALEMTFHPIEFFGFEIFRLKDQPWGFFGWQGIIPTKAEKMASITVDLMLQKLFDVKEIFNRLDPTNFSSVISDCLLLHLDIIFDEVATKYMPISWNNLPQELKNELVVCTSAECPQFLSSLMTDLQINIYNILDIKNMTLKACVENKAVMNNIFQEVGDKEFTFIKRSGFYFGFLFGCAQMILWYFYNRSWILPVGGFIVGWLTNSIALKIIFRPLNARKVACWTVHGIFLKRQNEVSRAFARIICVDILNIKAIWDAILHGSLHHNFEAILRAHSIVFTEKIMGSFRVFAVVAMGTDKYAQMKEDVASKVIENFPRIIEHSYEYTTSVLEIEETIREKMQSLSSRDFEGVLHPAFEEDEVTLIFVGGILGALVGVTQMFIFPTQS